MHRQSLWLYYYIYTHIEQGCLVMIMYVHEHFKVYVCVSHCVKLVPHAQMQLCMLFT